MFYNKVGEEIAIEVETGIKVKTQSKKKYHNQKFAEVKKKYGNRCYIFLPKAKLENSYKRHELPLLFRLDVEEFVTLQFSGKKNTSIVRKSKVTNEKNKGLKA